MLPHGAARVQRWRTAVQNDPVRGRFAPSPTGRLHLGNLRTALAALLSADAQGGDLVVRMEDLDPVTSSRDHERSQIADLASLGVHSGGVVVRQSERFELYRARLAELDDRGLVYRCYCTRREIREAASAPHGNGLGEGAYPGTCRDLSVAQVEAMERRGRPPAMRLRTHGERYSFCDLVSGHVEGAVDDVVLQRNDGVPAYNLAVVVDDHAQGVTEVVRGADLLGSTAGQLHLQQLLGLPSPTYAHVPLVVGADGERLAKRHGAITLGDLDALGVDATSVRSMLRASLGAATDGFRWADVPRVPWVFDIDRFDRNV